MFNRIQSNARIAAVSRHFEDMSRLEIVQEMCLNLTGEAPHSITQCKLLLRGIYINIFDYVEEKFDQKFSSKRKLANYTKSSGKVFPLRKAKSANLRYLLKELFV